MRAQISLAGKQNPFQKLKKKLIKKLFSTVCLLAFCHMLKVFAQIEGGGGAAFFAVQSGCWGRL